MKRLLLTAVALFSTAHPLATHASVIKCPDRHPTKEVALSTTPLDGGGTSRIRPARLSGAYFETGPLYVPPMFVPLITKVKDGWDTEYLFGPPDQPRWLVCRYGGTQWGSGAIERWEKLPQHFTSCVQKVREIKIRHATSDWTAAAVCK